MIRDCNSCCKGGVWSYADLIGAKARIKSLPVYNRFGRDSVNTDTTYTKEDFVFSKGTGKSFGKYSGDVTYTIEDLIFRVDETGKTICVIKLEGLDGDFTFKDLEITSLMPVIPIVNEELICGTVIVNG